MMESRAEVEELQSLHGHGRGDCRGQIGAVLHAKGAASVGQTLSTRGKISRRRTNCRFAAANPVPREN